MLKSSIFDINKITCPLCGKVHKVVRYDFNVYGFDCFVNSRHFDFVMNNYLPDNTRYWNKYLGRYIKK